MKRYKRSGGQRLLILRFSLSISLLFLLFILSVFTGLFYNNRMMIEEEMVNRARSHFSNIVLTRRWNAMYGGVFIEKTEGVESNPYLVNPDIETVDGKFYTMKNPALMTREISELASGTDDYQFRITSLKPINPGNAPDDFERKSLKLFEEGVEETFEKSVRENIVYLRYMGPLVTEESCLACHSSQGYEVGQIRGGISVTFRIDEIERNIRLNRKVIVVLSIASTLLLLSIFYFLIFRLNRKLSDAQKTIQDLAEKDSLTGLYNRRYLYEWAMRELERSIRYKQSLSVVMIDVDYFKKVNDEHGHKSGDLVLQALSKILLESGRRSDLSARYGGEEFIAVLPSTGLDGALKFSESLLEKIRGTSFPISPGKTIKITASLGISTRDFATDGDKPGLDDIIDEADQALYMAKERGRDRIEIYGSD